MLSKAHCRGLFPQPEEFKAPLVNAGSARGFPRSPSQHVRAFCTWDFSHTCSTAAWIQEQIGLCWDLAGMGAIWSWCPRKRARQPGCGPWGLWLYPARCSSVTLHAWVPQTAPPAQLPRHHHGSSMAPCKERGISSLPDGNYCIASRWVRNFPGRWKVQVQGCGSRGRSGLWSPATANALAGREKQERCPDSLFHRWSKMFPSVQKCRRTEREARGLMQDKWRFP